MTANNTLMEVTLYLRHIAEPIAVVLHDDVIIDLILLIQGSVDKMTSERSFNGTIQLPIGDPDDPDGYLNFFIEDFRALLR